MADTPTLRTFQPTREAPPEPISLLQFSYLGSRFAVVAYLESPPAGSIPVGGTHWLTLREESSRG